MPIQVDIEGFGTFTLKYLVTDLNGTIAIRGKLVKGLVSVLQKLHTQLSIYIVTADTFGTGSQIAADLGLNLHVLNDNIPQDIQKENFVKSLGQGEVVAMGNGRNDRLMLKTAKLSFAIFGEEGISPDCLNAADLIVKSPVEALNILLNPTMLRAGLRL